MTFRERCEAYGLGEDYEDLDIRVYIAMLANDNIFLNSFKKLGKNQKVKKPKLKTRDQAETEVLGQELIRRWTKKK